ncbi:hypothetical protein L1987_61864 [Smallanthus sonchifolius]|uniref:Uncharacterized protein n=1 Tax=Smallanthus sonchifolius TaxID=185202 RepID=A0ACB9C8U5_9ASTR|nr:hypothetical protein L1987_61864 [Smallanthus sonchifolius]
MSDSRGVKSDKWRDEGKDETDEFEDAGHSKSARELMETFCVGELDTSDIPQLEVVSEKQKTYIPEKLGSAEQAILGGSGGSCRHIGGCHLPVPTQQVAWNFECWGDFGP